MREAPRSTERQRSSGAPALHHGLAATAEEFDGAFRLVHDQYVARGYMTPHPSGRRTGLHHALASTRVFVSRAGGDVVGTLSLIPDSLLELPCDVLYREELRPLRDAGRHIAEVSAFAVAEDWRTARLDIVLALVHLVLVYSTRIARVDDLVITVNPRHAKFYERVLRFERFGPDKDHPGVQGAPAVPLRLDIRRAVAEASAAGDVRFAGRVLDPAETRRVQFALEDDLARLAATAAQAAASAPLGEALAGAV
jgi:hypothetical protein